MLSWLNLTKFGHWCGTFKSPLNSYLSEVEKTQTKVKQSNEKYSWHWVADKSLLDNCPTSVSPHQGPVNDSSFDFDLWALHSSLRNLQKVTSPSKASLSCLWRSDLISGFPHHATRLPGVELAVGCLQHVLQMARELWQRWEGFMQMLPAFHHLCINVALTNLHSYLSTDAESSPWKEKSWSSEISRGLISS